MFRELKFNHSLGIFFLIFGFPIYILGQSIDPIQLNKDISELNNQYKYDSSIVKLEKIIAEKSSSPLDKYHAYLQKAYTYKRLFNYPEVSNNLENALKEGIKSDQKKAVETRILIEKMFIQFDLLKFEEARTLFQQIDPKDLVLIDGTTRAFYLNVKASFHSFDKEYKEAEIALNQGIEILKKEDPQHLAAIYCKIINLAENTLDEEMAKSAFEQGMQYVEKYPIEIYKIRLLYDMSHFYLVKEDFKNAYYYQFKGSEVSGKYNAPYESGKLNLLEKELIHKKRDLELRNEQNIKLFLVVISIILLVLILVLFLLFKSHKQKRILIEIDNNRMRNELEKISQDLNEKDNLQSDFKSLNLSKRQLEIIELVKQGKTNKEIGTELFISENTVKYHLKVIYNLLGIDNRFDLK